MKTALLLVASAVLVVAGTEPASTVHGQTVSVAQRLGYPADAKLLLIHADDLGMCRSVNRASLTALERRTVTSASLMAPCPWFTEIAAYFKEHPEADVGLHLTLTSEFKMFRWGAVAPSNEVRSLLDPAGYLWATNPLAAQNIRPDEAETEIRAQIEQALKAGIRPTHIDSHMGTIFTSALLPTYIKVAHEYRIPFLMRRMPTTSSEVLAGLLQSDDVLVDNIATAGGSRSVSQLRDYYLDLVRSLKPGVTELIVHLGYDDAELRAITEGWSAYGSAWRQRDLDVITSEEFKKTLRDNNVILIGWRDLQRICSGQGASKSRSQTVIRREDLPANRTAKTVFRYRNPISDGIDPRGLRDCQVFRDNGKWYLTGTAYPVWPKEDMFGQLNPGVPLYSSDDLLHWKFERILVRPNPEKWYFMRFWSPEIHKIHGKYYLSMHCRNPALGDNLLRMGYAVADQLMGPYKVIDQPLGKGNDLHFFQDDDGRVWAFWNRVVEPGPDYDKETVRAFGVACAPFELAAGKFLGPPIKVLDYGREGVDWDGVGMEGEYVIKRNGIYYLFYSSWTRGYEIGYATARNVTGPWTKFSGNPIYGGQDPAYCRKHGVPYTGDPQAPFAHAGSTNIFTGPDGRLWLSCHGILAADPKQVPMPMIEPLDFDADGRVIISGPDLKLREIALP